MYDKACVPEWYRRGADVSELIDAASGLDWTADTGGEVRPGSLKLPPPPPPTDPESATDQPQDNNHQQQGAQAPAPPPASGNTPLAAPATSNGMDTMDFSESAAAVGMDNLTIAVSTGR